MISRFEYSYASSVTTGCVREVVRQRRRLRRPLESGRVPRIRAGPLALEQRRDEVDADQHVADRQNRCAGRRQHVQHLELRRVDVVAARHAQIAEDELRDERQVEPDETMMRRHLGPDVGVHAAGDLRPPVVQAGEVAHDRAADHDVVEVRDDEVGVVEVDVEAERGQEEPGEAADEEQAQEAERPDHRRLPPDRALVHRRRPVERLHGRRDRDGEGQEREHQRRVRARCPATNRWCAHTRKPKTAIARLEKATNE